MDEMLGDGSCDAPCNVIACTFDHGDCRLRLARRVDAPMLATAPATQRATWRRATSTTAIASRVDCSPGARTTGWAMVIVTALATPTPAAGIAATCNCATDCWPNWPGDGYCDEAATTPPVVTTAAIATVHPAAGQADQRWHVRARMNNSSCGFDGTDCPQLCAPNCRTPT